MRHLIHQPARLAAVVLAAIVAFQSVGWLLAWEGLQFEARKEAQRVLFQGVNTLQKNIFHQDFFQKIKIDGREIRLDGQLFDYRILSEKGDSVLVVLYHDSKEEALLSALGQVFESEDNTNMPSSSPMALWLAKWLGSAFLLPEKPAIASDIAARFLRQNFATFLFAPQFAPSVFAPPPEV
ncbi:MAG: hypothetical protein H7246_08870 [Phycisphaerae bacterium]|nr:hypothetical protein [Saprospiraceae bacterium]